MDKGREFLGEIVLHTKYCNYLPEQKRRETFKEVVDRTFNMFLKKFPERDVEIALCKQAVLDGRILPSMRNMNFGGAAVEQHNARSFNCSFTHMTNTKNFADSMYLLLCGVGVGYSVQQHHVAQLPIVQNRFTKELDDVHFVQDSIEGWADSIKILLDSYLSSDSPYVSFRYDLIRPKGSLIKSSGAKAPGHEPLKKAHGLMCQILDMASGRQLKPIEVHDLMCILADAVLSGGVRRSAMISLFSKDDREMLLCKSGEFWKVRPERSRANNSCLLLRGEVSEQEFKELWNLVESNKTGEPAFIWTNDLEWGYNPCVEASLRAYTFCNLTEINARLIESQKDLDEICQIASWIGTFQASFTGFNYLDKIWQERTEEDALLGVSFTGITNSILHELDLERGAKIVVETNRVMAEIIGINQSARTTLVKPAGKTSCIFQTDSGIHDGHSHFFARTVRLNKAEGLYDHLVQIMPELVEDEFGNEEHGSVVTFPCTTPKQFSTKDDITAIQLLERIKFFSEKWVKPGHVRGINSHNVSATVNVKSLSGNKLALIVDGILQSIGSSKVCKGVVRSEWEEVGQWLWDNQDSYNGLSVMPHDGGVYKQAPFQKISEKKYNKLMKFLPKELRLEDIEENINYEGNDSIACSGGQCDNIYI